jgi:hypothetical protein
LKSWPTSTRRIYFSSNCSPARRYTLFYCSVIQRTSRRASSTLKTKSKRFSSMPKHRHSPLPMSKNSILELRNSRSIEAIGFHGQPLWRTENVMSSNAFFVWILSISNIITSTLNAKFDIVDKKITHLKWIYSKDSTTKWLSHDNIPALFSHNVNYLQWNRTSEWK